MQARRMERQQLSLIGDLGPAFRQRLGSMYEGEPQTGTNGLVEMDKTTQISREQGMWIYDTCRNVKPKRTLEVGLAYGFSTIYFLAAIDRIGTGHHTAIDPFRRMCGTVWALSMRSA